MFKTLLHTVLMAAALLIGSAVMAAPLEAYGKLPKIESATVSPSGHAVAVVVSDGEKRTIVVKDLASNAILLRGYLGEHKFRDVRWAGDRHLLVVHSATLTNFNVENGRREWLFGSIVDIAAKRMKPMLNNSVADLTAIFGIPTVRMFHGEPAVFVQGMVFAGGRGQLTLFRIDPQTGVTRVIGSGGPDVTDWAIDSEGNPLAQELYDGSAKKWTLKVRDGQGWREAVSVTAPLDRPSLVGMGRDGASVIYAMQAPDGQWLWHEVRTDRRPPGAPTPMADEQGTLRAALDGRMIGQATLVGDEERYTFFDPADARAWQAISDAFPGERTQLQSWSMDRRKIAVLAETKAGGPAFAIIDMTTREADWLGAQYSDLKGEDIAQQSPIRFKAADGLNLSGYLTLPQGRAAMNLPMVVLPHGGPAVRDEPGFDWWAQALASRGYAVLQVNYRGSGGFGEAFVKAGHGEWGRKMQTDLSDGVRYLAAQGVIDAKRVCIVGGSYGGYAALAGATHGTGVYRCAVSVAGLSDLRRFMVWSNGRSGSPALRYWSRFMGVDGSGDPKLAEYSPALHADRAAAPILLIHGQDDSVVPYEQSEVMAAALRKAGKPVEFVTMKGEDHWLSRGETRLQMLTATTAFLEKYNPPN